MEVLDQAHVSDPLDPRIPARISATDARLRPEREHEPTIAIGEAAVLENLEVGDQGRAVVRADGYEDEVVAALRRPGDGMSVLCMKDDKATIGRGIGEVDNEAGRAEPKEGLEHPRSLTPAKVLEFTIGIDMPQHVDLGLVGEDKGHRQRGHPGRDLSISL
jgi:hypothetical protein